MEKDIFQRLKEKWPSAIVARTEIAAFTGGVLSEKYCANLDCQGLGPKRIKVGNRVCYPIDSLIEWLEGRSNLNPAQKHSSTCEEACHDCY